MRYHKIKAKIQQNYSALPKNQKKVADFFVDNFDSIPFQSVQEVSRATSSSVATIVRFAQRIGFTGFSEMREQISQHLQSHIHSKEIFPLIDEEELSKDTLTAVANQEIKNINNTLSLIERINFHSAVDHIINAEHVFTMGLGISNLLSQILAYQLNQVGIDARPFRHDFTYFPEQLLFVKPNDLIVAFSFPPYSTETIDTARFAKERNIKVIALTNRNASPITRHADISLCIQSHNMLFTNSYSAISVVINAISTECAVKNKVLAEKMVEEMDKIMKGQNNTIA